MVDRPSHPPCATRRVEVFEVDGTARATGHLDRLVEGLPLGARWVVLRVADVKTQGHGVAGGQLTVGDHLRGLEVDCVLGLLVDADRPCLQVGFGESQQFGPLVSDGPLDPDADVLAMLVMVDSPPVVDRGLERPGLGQELGHWVVEPVEAQVGGDPVGDLVPVAVAVRTVGEDVDEPWCDDQAGRIEGGPAGQRFEADPGHAVAVHPDMGQRIEAGVRVDDPASGDHRVVEVVVAVYPGGVQGRWHLDRS